MDWFWFQKPLAIDPFRIPRYQDFWDKSLGGFLGFQYRVNLNIEGEPHLNMSYPPPLAWWPVALTRCDWEIQNKEEENYSAKTSGPDCEDISVVLYS